jgi:hypothetical protein
MTPDELDLIETEELLRALARRFDAYLFVLMKQRSDSAEERGLYYAGGLITAVGMTEWAKNCLLTDRDIAAIEPDDDE